MDGYSTDDSENAKSQAQGLRNDTSEDDFVIIDEDQQVLDLSNQLDKAMLIKESRTNPNKRKKCNTTIQSNLSDATIIAEKQPNKKCQGFLPDVLHGQIWNLFPFQLFQTTELPFVVENGVFHSLECLENNYIYKQNTQFLLINTSCNDLQYNSKLS